jgi:hypothetical protein
MGEIEPVEGGMAVFGRITTIMAASQAAGPYLAGSLADATGIINSGLWISIVAAVCGASWSLRMHML